MEGDDEEGEIGNDMCCMEVITGMFSGSGKASLSGTVLAREYMLTVPPGTEVPPKASLRDRGQWKWIAEVHQGEVRR